MPSSLCDGDGFTWSVVTLHLESAGDMRHWSSLRKEIKMSEEAANKNSLDGERNVHVGYELLESYGRGEDIESGSIWAEFWEDEVVT